MSCIPLAKPYTPEKMTFPAELQQKYDGVPIRIDWTNDEGVFQLDFRTRQGNDVLSLDKLMCRIGEALEAEAHETATFVGEIVSKNPKHSFKDVSGMVRQEQRDVSDEVELYIFDCSGDKAYAERMGDYCFSLLLVKGVYVVEAYAIVGDPAQAGDLFYEFMADNPDAEGMILRSRNDGWNPGKRSWGYQKMLNEPTIDLEIVGFEEAVDKYGDPKGMVGRVLAAYHGKVIGVGPGKLTHKERTELWERWESGWGPTLGIAEIKYKHDPSYDALREPTFQCWRLDKEEPDA